MTNAISYRWALLRDFTELGDVMFDAVRHGDSPYTEHQRRAWVPHPRKGADWAARLQGQRIRLAETDGRIIGFMSLRPDGYVDFAYIRPSARGRGVFRTLYDALEAEARRHPLRLLTTHASLMAAPAFAAMGFQVTQEETVPLGGARLRRFAMAKTL
ncbi:MAG: GNAT family N-acetyltransferase [Pseudomonadota bacterium]